MGNSNITSSLISSDISLSLIVRAHRFFKAKPPMQKSNITSSLISSDNTSLLMSSDITSSLISSDISLSLIVRAHRFFKAKPPMQNSNITSSLISSDNTSSLISLDITSSLTVKANLLNLLCATQILHRRLFLRTLHRQFSCFELTSIFMKVVEFTFIPLMYDLAAVGMLL